MYEIKTMTFQIIRKYLLRNIPSIIGKLLVILIKNVEIHAHKFHINIENDGSFIIHHFMFIIMRNSLLDQDSAYAILI